MSDMHEAPLRGLSILIAEDSWHLADEIRTFVERSGGNVVGIVGTVSKAEKLATSATFCTAVMDLDLHGERAHALALRLVEAGKKVVVLTGFERPAELADKVHECLIKPIPGEVLIATLARPLRARAS